MGISSGAGGNCVLPEPLSAICSEILTARIVLLHAHQEDVMDQDERIENLKAEIRRLNGGVDPPSFGIDQLPKDMVERFLKQVIAVETGQTGNKREPLSGDGKVWHVAIPRGGKSN